MRDREVSDEVFARLDTWVIRKSPDRYGGTIPANIVYKFIDLMSDRGNRGLRVSKDALREVEQLDPEELAGDAVYSPAFVRSGIIRVIRRHSLRNRIER